MLADWSSLRKPPWLPDNFEVARRFNPGEIVPRKGSGKTVEKSSKIAPLGAPHFWTLIFGNFRPYPSVRFELKLSQGVPLRDALGALFQKPFPSALILLGRKSSAD